MSKGTKGGAGGGTHCSSDNAKRSDQPYGNGCVWDSKMCVNKYSQCGIKESEVAEKCGKWAACGGVVCRADYGGYCLARRASEIAKGTVHSTMWAYTKKTASCGSEAASSYTLIGSGHCVDNSNRRPGHCYTTSISTESSCKSACDAVTGCAAYEWGQTGNYCQLIWTSGLTSNGNKQHSPVAGSCDSAVHKNWKYNLNADGGKTITKTHHNTGGKCYKKSAGQPASAGPVEVHSGRCAGAHKWFGGATKADCVKKTLAWSRCIIQGGGTFAYMNWQESMGGKCSCCTYKISNPASISYHDAEYYKMFKVSGSSTPSAAYKLVKKNTVCGADTTLVHSGQAISVSQCAKMAADNKGDKCPADPDGQYFMYNPSYRGKPFCGCTRKGHRCGPHAWGGIDLYKNP